MNLLDLIEGLRYIKFDPSTGRYEIAPLPEELNQLLNKLRESREEENT
jgi:hypothetical protein